MSWNGTVTCRFCGERGHNKRTCPAYTERLKERSEAEVNQGDERGYWHTQYAKRTGQWVDGSSAKELKKGRRDAGQKRRCTYCGTQGHNRRSCPQLQTDTANYIEKLMEFRKNIVADMAERGLSVGALLLQERWSEKFLVLIDKVHWESVTHVMGNAEIFQGLNPRTSRRHSCGYPEGDFNQSSYHRVNVVGPVGAETVVPPADFFCEKAAAPVAKEFFKERRSDNYHDNYYTYG